MARRPRLPQPADRRHRQHAPRRVLHRQAVLARQQQRPAGAGGAAGVRDAAARAHEPDAAAAAAGAGRLVLENAVQSVARPLGHRAARSLHAAAFRRRRTSTMCSPTCDAAATGCETGVVRAASGVPLPAVRRGDARAACSSNCARRSSRGTCWARKPGAGGTVRYVDSSVERLQVKVTGMTDSRHVVACNGRRVPLHPTGTVGEFVAGVRYRAWQPPSGLHPTIPVHAPLVFDLVDTWNERSMGGCIYHVAHPGGRSFETFPGQRLRGREPAPGAVLRHRPHAGPGERPARRAQPGLPVTLDLRRAACAPSCDVARGRPRESR